MRVLFFFLFLFSPLFSQRIITLSPAVNEIVFALKKGDDIVGNTQYCTFPKTSKTIPKVGGYYNISLEKVLALNPSLVILEKNNLSLVPKFQKLHIETMAISTVSLPVLFESFEKIGMKIGASTEAKKLIDSIKKSILKTQNILKDKKILIVFGSHLNLQKQIYVSGNHLYFADIIRASGNKNAFEGKSTKQPSLSYEGLIATNPDIVIILAPFAKKQNRSIKGIIKPWLSMPITAAKKHCIYVIDKDYAGIPSDRVRFFIHDFEGALRDAKDKFSAL
jgi:iron complex transport system substrate-binding protein